MKAEIICVGTELLLGDIVNTNARYLSRQLAKLGIDMYYQSVVGDNGARLLEALKQALSRSELILFIGGLGPTKDDLTKETICSALGLEMEIHQPSLDKIKEYYAHLCAQMTENNVKQALVPKGAEIFENHHGSAPGCAIHKGNQYIVMLPGPPSEFEPMVEEWVVPYLQSITGCTIWSTTLREFGIGESLLETKIDDLLQGQNPTAAVYAKEGEVEVRITAKAASEAEAKSLCAGVVEEMKTRLGDAVYGQDVESMQEAVVAALKEKKLTLATAESCTGGLMSQRITQVPGASAVFGFGAATYADFAKQNTLGIRRSYFKKYGAVSEQVACRMALGARRRGHSDIGVGITGVAGPDSDDRGNPVGTVYIAAAFGKQLYVRKLELKNGNTSREKIRHLACMHALDLVRRLALGLDLSAYTSYKIASYTRGDRAVRALDGVRVLAFYLALCVFIGSLTLVGQYLYEGWQNKNKNSELTSLYTSGADVDVELPEGYLDDFKALYLKNREVAGWIKVPNTQIDYPIVQTTDNSFYLKNDFFKEYSKYGTLFFDYRNDLQNPAENLVIYGHNMKDSQMFGDLTKFRDLEFYKANPVFEMNTVYEKSQYKVLAIFTANTEPSQGEVFDYYNSLSFLTEEGFDEFVGEITSRSLIETPVDTQYGDTLVTLSTCLYDYDGQRLVLVGRKVREGEEATVDVEQAQKNPSPVQPKLYKNGDLASVDLNTDLSHLTQTQVSKPTPGGSSSSPAHSGGQGSASSAPTVPVDGSSSSSSSSTPSGGGSSSGSASSGGSSSSSSSSSQPEAEPEEQLPQSIYGLSIMGESSLTADQLAAYVLANNPSPQLNCSVKELASYFLSEGRAEGVRGDIAFCQAIHETGFFRFTGDVKWTQNNYGGLGATGGGEPGLSFDSPRIGARANIQHLKGYGSAAPLNQACVDPRYKYISPKGKAPLWENLAGTWAADSGYAAKLNSHYQRALQY